MLARPLSAPDFTLPDAEGQMHTLQQYSGSWVLLYFYPEDDTSGCTREACGFRDHFPRIQAEGLVVLGVSADSPDSHARFKDKYQLPFTLLADEQKQAITAYGVWREKERAGKKYMGIARVSFLIDPKGTIAKIYDPVVPEKHAEEVLEDLRRVLE